MKHTVDYSFIEKKERPFMNAGELEDFLANLTGFNYKIKNFLYVTSNGRIMVFDEQDSFSFDLIEDSYCAIAEHYMRSGDTSLLKEDIKSIKVNKIMFE